MTKTYRDWSTDQAYLFPPSPHDWLPEGDIVYFLLDWMGTPETATIIISVAVAFITRLFAPRLPR